MTATYAHDPVMVEEILGALALQSGDVVVDGTLGLAGHSMHFIDAIRPGGILVGLDWDESMLAIAQHRVGKPEGVTVHLVHSDFRDMKEVLVEYGIRPNGILLDLGLNSAQIEDPARGITFKEDGPLDMRMDRSKGEPASALLNRMSPQAIQDALEDFGDEKWAHRIAQKILLRRKEQPLRTTNDLIECVLAAIPINAREKRIHPATRTFQAVRILTNAEFDGLREAILEAASMLAENGNLAILSYHSGEDRIVKRAYQELAQEGFVLTDKKPRIPSEAEIGRNARSRSAKLRVIRKEVKS